MERKNVFTDITQKVKTKGKELINLVYTPTEDEPIKPNTPENELDGNDEVDNRKQDLQTPEQIIETLDGSAKLWIGKDYVNFIVKDFTNLDSPFDDFIDRVRFKCKHNFALEINAYFKNGKFFKKCMF